MGSRRCRPDPRQSLLGEAGHRSPTGWLQGTRAVPSRLAEPPERTRQADGIRRQAITLWGQQRDQDRLRVHLADARTAEGPAHLGSRQHRVKTRPLGADEAGHDPSIAFRGMAGVTPAGMHSQQVSLGKTTFRILQMDRAPSPRRLRPRYGPLSRLDPTPCRG